MDLINAILKKDMHRVKNLLEQGADPNMYLDEAMIRPLHFAAQNNFLKIVPLLITAGADLYAQIQPEGHTPLDIARLHKNNAMVNVLQSFMLQRSA